MSCHEDQGPDEEESEHDYYESQTDIRQPRLQPFVFSLGLRKAVRGISEARMRNHGDQVSAYQPHVSFGVVLKRYSTLCLDLSSDCRWAVSLYPYGTEGLVGDPSYIGQLFPPEW